MGIFVSYRRSDSPGEAGRLFDDLIRPFGEQRVFMDVAAIEAGRDFRKAIEEGVARCGVLLVVIGPEWLNAKNERGVRRLDDPGDFVRIEAASALKRDIPVIPILVRNAKMPSPEELPLDLKELAYRNCIELTHVRWRSDIQVLIDALRRLMGEVTQEITMEEVMRAQSSAASVEIADPPPAADSAQIDPATLQNVSRELAHYIGQIAAIVVKRAARHSTSLEDVYLKVAEEIDSPEERKQFLLSVPVAS